MKTLVQIHNGVAALWLGSLCSVSLASGPVGQQAYLKASNAGSNDTFGNAAAISGDTLVVGAPTEDSVATGVDGNGADNGAPDSGAAYVYVRTGTNWSLQAYLKASNTDAGDQFGFSVAVDGDTIVIGAPFEDGHATGVNGDGSNNVTPDSGAAYVYSRTGTNWSLQAYLKASNTGTMDQFGVAVGVAGDLIVVGANREDSSSSGVNGDESSKDTPDSGAAFVFVRGGTNWSQQAYLKASNTGAGDQFGWPVAVSGETIVVGAKAEDSRARGVDGEQTDDSASNSGAVYVFVRDGPAWSQQAYLKASNTGAADEFGRELAISAGTVVVGAWYEDSGSSGVNGDENNDSVTDSGAAYVFVRTGAAWSQQAYLKASNTEANNDRFGRSVGVWGDTLVVGATREDSGATGVNGNQNDKSAPESGAAYVFLRCTTNWIQQAYLKASNTEAGDTFGVSVAVSGDTVAVGGVFEDSSAAGVNGNQRDNGAIDSGAVYVFTGVGIDRRVSIEPGEAGYFLRFDAVPNLTYELQRAAGAEGAWSTVDSTTPTKWGTCEFHDGDPPDGQALYRVVLQ